MESKRRSRLFPHAKFIRAIRRVSLSSWWMRRARDTSALRVPWRFTREYLRIEHDTPEETR
jgi:hypothetical protein